jgi:hypothetical protein
MAAYGGGVSHYEVLGLPETATSKEIRERYHELARAVHPDAGGDIFQFQVLEQAFAVLGDPDARRNYDLQRSAESTGRGDDTDRGRNEAVPGRTASVATDGGVVGWATQGCFAEVVGWVVAVPILAALALAGWLLGVGYEPLVWGTAVVVVAYVIVRDIRASKRG